MSKELVRLRRKAVDAIELMRAKGAPNNEIIERHINKDHIQVNNFDYVASLATDTLIRALYIGYEIEETPADKVKEYYNFIGTWTGDYDGADIQEVIRNVLDHLNIKISGVNA